MRKYVTMLVLLMLIGATLFPSPATPRFTIRSFSVHGAQNRDCSGCANYDRCLSENRGHDNCKQYIPAGCSCAAPADKPPETSEERAKREERERRIDRCERDCVAEKQRRQRNVRTEQELLLLHASMRLALTMTLVCENAVVSAFQQ